MAELKKALIRTMHQEGGGGPSIITPDLCTDVRLAVPKRKAARLIGAIARKAQEQKKANALAKEGLEDGTKKNRGEKVQVLIGDVGLGMTKACLTRLICW